jgi:hypothetical protein
MVLSNVVIRLILRFLLNYGFVIIVLKYGSVEMFLSHSFIYIFLIIRLQGCNFCRKLRLAFRNNFVIIKCLIIGIM